jgi:hypothetical protein
MLTFKPKNDIFEEHFWTSCDFYKSVRKKKKFEPLYPLERTWRTFKTIEKGPRLKKSGHTWYRLLRKKSRMWCSVTDPNPIFLMVLLSFLTRQFEISCCSHLNLFLNEILNIYFRCNKFQSINFLSKTHLMFR